MRSIGPALTLCACIAAATVLDGCAPGPSGSSTANQGTGGASGGTNGSGGSTASGGSRGTAGATATGGAAATGGSAGSGGVTGRGGTTGAGGTSAAAGTIGSGGALGSAGASGSGGGSSSGGTIGSGGSSAKGGAAGAGATGPCDIYQAANTPCGAAHSTARALYGAYTGPLYQVQRASDKSTKDIPVGTGGFADASVQDSFCSGTTCTIPIIYDQSSNGNHLRVTWFAYWLQSGGNPASATAAKITVGGHTVYGIKSGTNVAYRTGVALSGTAAINKGSSTATFSSPQTLPANTALLFAANSKDCPANSWPNNCNFRVYLTAAAITAATTVTLTTSYTGTSSSSTAVWNQSTKGIATGDQAEAMYSVLDGKTYGQWCCFDYGNSELPGIDDGNATMEAIYFGADTQFGQSGGGSGPWVAADLENGMYEGYENGSSKVASNTSVTGFPYVTAMLKGLSAKDCPSGLTASGCFALKAGNATSGMLAFKFNADTMSYGARPPGYSPQKKEGAIILATGGDGSNTGTGIWFEGAMTMGAPSDATDDAVQANIVAAGYGR
jgi:hypothetical protein